MMPPTPIDTSGDVERTSDEGESPPPSPPPLLFQEETLHGLLDAIVGIKRSQYDWINQAENRLRQLWKRRGAEASTNDDLALRQELLSLKRAFARTTKKERRLLRDFTIACGLPHDQVPRYFWRGYDPTSPNALKQRKRIAAFSKLDLSDVVDHTSDNESPMRWMQRLHNVSSDSDNASEPKRNERCTQTKIDSCAQCVALKEETKRTQASMLRDFQVVLEDQLRERDEREKSLRTNEATLKQAHAEAVETMRREIATRSESERTLCANEAALKQAHAEAVETLRREVAARSESERTLRAAETTLRNAHAKANDEIEMTKTELRTQREREKEIRASEAAVAKARADLTRELGQARSNLEASHVRNEQLNAQLCRHTEDSRRIAHAHAASLASHKEAVESESSRCARLEARLRDVEAQSRRALSTLEQESKSETARALEQARTSEKRASTSEEALLRLRKTSADRLSDELERLAAAAAAETRKTREIRTQCEAAAHAKIAEAEAIAKRTCREQALKCEAVCVRQREAVVRIRRDVASEICDAQKELCERFEDGVRLRGATRALRAGEERKDIEMRMRQSFRRQLRVVTENLESFVVSLLLECRTCFPLASDLAGVVRQKRAQLLALAIEDVDVDGDRSTPLMNAVVSATDTALKASEHQLMRARDTLSTEIGTEERRREEAERALMRSQRLAAELESDMREDRARHEAEDELRRTELEALQTKADACDEAECCVSREIEARAQLESEMVRVEGRWQIACADAKRFEIAEEATLRAERVYAGLLDRESSVSKRLSGQLTSSTELSARLEEVCEASALEVTRLEAATMKLRGEYVSSNDARANEAEALASARSRITSMRGVERRLETSESEFRESEARCRRLEEETEERGRALMSETNALVQLRETTTSALEGERARMVRLRDELETAIERSTVLEERASQMSEAHETSAARANRETDAVAELSVELAESRVAIVRESETNVRVRADLSTAVESVEKEQNACAQLRDSLSAAKRDLASRHAELERRVRERDRARRALVEGAKRVERFLTRRLERSTKERLASHASRLRACTHQLRAVDPIVRSLSADVREARARASDRDALREEIDRLERRLAASLDDAEAVRTKIEQYKRRAKVAEGRAERWRHERDEARLELRRRVRPDSGEEDAKEEGTHALRRTNAHFGEWRTYGTSSSPPVAKQKTKKPVDRPMSGAPFGRISLLRGSINELLGALHNRDGVE